MVGVSLDKNLEVFKRAMARAALPWPQVSDGKGEKGKIPQLFHVEGVPASYLLDRDGKIAGKSLSGEKLREKVAGLIAQAPAVSSPSESREQELERTWKVAEMFEAAGLKEGSVVAEVGSGPGFWVLRLARAVGSSGQVYGVDLKESAVKQLREKVTKEGLTNVTAILGEPDNPKLPANALDAVLIVNAYHEVEKYTQVLEHVRTALKPGGRLVVVDVMPRKTRTRPRAIQTKNHVLAPDLAEPEIRQAGFEIVARLDDFINRPDEEESRWMIVARRP